MGTMRPDKYDGTKAYRVCHEFIPPDGVDCGSTLQWKGVRSYSAIEMLTKISQNRKRRESRYDQLLSKSNDYNRFRFARKKGPAVDNILQTSKQIFMFQGEELEPCRTKIPENGRHRCQFYEQSEGGYSMYVSVINKTHAIGFNKHGNQLRTNKQRRLNCFMFFKCSKQRDEGCFKGAMEIGKNDLSDSNSISSVNTGQSNGNNYRNSNNNKNMISNNNNNNNSNKNGKKLNKKSQQSPNKENIKNKKGVGKRGGKSKRRHINNNEKFNSNNSSSSINNNSNNNLKQVQIDEPVDSNRRLNIYPKQQTTLMKQQRKNTRPVRHPHNRHHHQQQLNDEDKIAQMYENLKNN